MVKPYEVVDVEPAPEDLISMWGKEVSEKNVGKYFGHEGSFAAGGPWSKNPSGGFLEESLILAGEFGNSGGRKGVSTDTLEDGLRKEKGPLVRKAPSPSKAFSPSGGLEDIINFSACQGVWTSVEGFSSTGKIGAKNLSHLEVSNRNISKICFMSGRGGRFCPLFWVRTLHRIFPRGGTPKPLLLKEWKVRMAPLQKMRKRPVVAQTLTSMNQMHLILTDL